MPNVEGGKPASSKSTVRICSKTFQHKKRLTIGAVALGVGVLLLVAIVVVVNKSDQTCSSVECKKAAESIRKSMDMVTSPCEDFYRFACGKWSSVLSSELHVDSSQLDYRITSTVDYADILQEQDRIKMLRMMDKIQPRDIEALQQLKIFFKSCTDIGMGSSTSVDKEWIGELLDRTFLPDDSIGRTLARINRELGLSFLFTVGVAVKEDNNLEKEMIIDELPKTTDDLHLVPILREFELRRIYLRFFDEVYDLTSNLGIVDDNKSAETIAELDNNLDMVMAGSKNSSEPGNSNHFSLADLNELVPTLNYAGSEGEMSNMQHASEMNWIEYMESLFEGIPDVNISPDFVVNVRNVDYVKRVGLFLAITPIDQMRMSLIFRVLLKLETDLTDMAKLGLDARRQVCVIALEKAIPFAMAHKLVMASAREGKTKQVREIFDHVSVAFNSTISSLDWMSPVTKSHAMRKVANIKAHISYPHWLLNSSKVNEYYEGLNFTNNNGKLASYDQNAVTFRKWETEKELKEFHRPVSADYLWEHIGTSPVTVNAFYLKEHNAIVMPDGYLRFPHFGTGISALDYGALGYAFGHEMAHGFDSVGRERDETGKLSSWWNITREGSFKNKTQCLIDQYEGYWTEEKGASKPEPGAMANRSRTLNEDISDNWGLRAAFEAYQMNMNSSGAEEQNLPALEKYSSEQLFFLSFAHSHCTYNVQSGERSWEMGTHSPNWMRVIGPLSNYEEFSRVWKCPVGSGMNPEKKCVL